MKLKLLFIFLFVTTGVFAQIINIPDANFKNKLLQASLTNGVAKDIAYQNIVVDINGDGEIEQAEALRVYRLGLQASSIASLEGISYFTNLLDLYCTNNQLTSLNVQSLGNLKQFSCSNNAITALNLAGLSNLETVNVYSNPLVSLNTSGLLNLKIISISNTLLREVNLSNSPLLEYFNIYNNSDLRSINIKNGGNILYPRECNIINNPLLESICVDEDEAAIMLDNSDFANVTMSTDCEGATLYNTIRGHLQVDIDGNGCDANDNSPYMVKVRLFDGTIDRYRFTDSNGDYFFITQDGDYSISPALEQQLFSYAPANASIVFATVDNSVFTQDFCLAANGLHPDLEIIITPYIFARPGFNAKYRISCYNKGNQPLSGSFIFNFDDNVLDFVESTLAPSATGTGTITWSYENLLPFQHNTTVVTLAVNSPLDTPAVTVGDILNFSAQAVVENDATPNNNTFNFAQTVIGSLDPNNIVCLEGASVPTQKIGEYLHYTINFENIGTAAAEFVIVTNEIDADKYDINSVEILDSSNPVQVSQDGNVLTFRFDDIALAPAAYGNVSFKIKSLNTLGEGDAVMSQASIVFDYNEAIVTNEAITTFDDFAGTDGFSLGNVTLFPNPAHDILKVESRTLLTAVSIYDIQGRKLSEQLIDDALTATLNISAQPAGIYILKIITKEGSTSRKIVKQ
ncbi:DUF7619 domain-containing protein [Flavobacterium psychrotrophum]|uniref:DUF7619 domain-containing protein n=1 Tax=Flavobacterium psychrotrophum TaxID=2294119 RepID=UPI000E30F628|nr:T9SS type A sorting domain-containing protein [Flavobacterium psychrotrophum]